MRRFRKILRGIFAVWILWSVCMAGYETVNVGIPSDMWIYEEDAVAVLSGSGKTISPGDLNLDFAGNITVSEKKKGSYSAACSLFGVIPLKTMNVEVVSRQSVLPGGIPVGIYVQTDGVFVVGTGQIETENGQIESPAGNVIKTGDYIMTFEGMPIDGKKKLIELLDEFEGEELTLGIRRGEEEIDVAVRPVYVNGECRIGVWVRDDTQGIGMLTYITPERKFGALGHGISDADSSLLMEVSSGKLYDCEIFQITRGKSGEPGKLSGRIKYDRNLCLGKISGNRSGGIYGEGNEKLMAKVKRTPLEIALKQEIEEGEATILSSVDGSLKEYRIEITKVHRGERDINRGMELRVTDEALLALTGGIVQGMSGSPILQNGKIVGAVTHVFVNDPQRGYGIFIEEMLEPKVN